MSFPLNGRIAIVDDKIEQAQPLIKVLSKKQYPFTYYSGELKYLPDKSSQCNDIRVLFLDINLIDDSIHEDKVIKSRLIPVLNTILSDKNYPYIVVFWSRDSTHSYRTPNI